MSLRVSMVGVVREQAHQQEAVDKVTAFARETLALTPLGVVPSKVRGPKGNQEYLAAFRRTAASAGAGD